jgi:hypothetical protein
MVRSGSRTYAVCPRPVRIPRVLTVGSENRWSPKRSHRSGDRRANGNVGSAAGLAAAEPLTGGGTATVTEGTEGAIKE